MADVPPPDAHVIGPSIALSQKRVVVALGGLVTAIACLATGLHVVAAIVLIASMVVGAALVRDRYLASMAIAETDECLWYRRARTWHAIPWSSLRALTLGSFRGIWTLTLFSEDQRSPSARVNRRQGPEWVRDSSDIRVSMFLMWMFPPAVLYPMLQRRVTSSLRVDPGVFRAVFSPIPYPADDLLVQRGRHGVPAELSGAPSIGDPLTVATWPSRRDRQFGIWVALAASGIAVAEADRRSISEWANDIARRAHDSGAWWLGAFVAHVRDDDTPPEGGLWIAMVTARIDDSPIIGEDGQPVVVGDRPARIKTFDRRHEVSVELHAPGVWLNAVSEQPADPHDDFVPTLLRSVSEVADMAVAHLAAGR